MAGLVGAWISEEHGTFASFHIITPFILLRTPIGDISLQKN